MAGPGDSYAKETRAYNPDFAQDHPEEEYDQKVQEVRLFIALLMEAVGLTRVAPN